MKKSNAVQKITVEVEPVRKYTRGEINNTPDPSMCDTIIANAPHIEGCAIYTHVPVKLMALDHRYQRKLDWKHVDELKEHWSTEKCGTLIVSYRDGLFYIVDGQHRYFAAVESGVVYLHCQVLTGRTYREEAGVFLRQDVLKRRVTGSAKLDAGEAEGKDPVYGQITALCRNRGVNYRATSSTVPGSLHSVDTAIKIVRSGSIQMLANVFDIIGAAGWNLYPKAYHQCILNSVFNIVSHHDMEIVADKVIPMLSEFTPNEFLKMVDAKYPENTKTEAATLFMERLING